MKLQSKLASSPIGASPFPAFQPSHQATTLNPLPKLESPKRKLKKPKDLPVEKQFFSLSIVLPRSESPVYAGLDAEMEAVLRDIDDEERGMPIARSQSEIGSHKETKVRRGREWSMQRKFAGKIKPLGKSVEAKRYSEDITQLAHTPVFGQQHSRQYHYSKDSKVRKSGSFVYSKASTLARPFRITRNKVKSLETLQQTRSNKIHLFVS
jgi:hypothetical protein